MTYVSICLRKPGGQGLMWIRYTSPSPEAGTQMSPKALAAGNGVFPTAIVFITRFVAGSMRETVFEPTLGTKTVPSAATAGFSGWESTWIFASTFRVRGSSRQTESDRRFETQIAVFDAARERGPSPTRIALTLFVRASIRKILCPSWAPTQTAPA